MNDTKQEPGCECPARKALEALFGLYLPAKCKEEYCTCRICNAIAALSTPCSCEQLRAEYDRLGLSYVALEGLYECSAQIIREERSERDAARSLLEEARLALRIAQAILGSVTQDSLYDAGKRKVDAALAKIEAAQKDGAA